MRDIVYNGVKLNEYMIVKEVKESILPNVSNISLSLSKGVGSKFIKQNLEAREINIDIEIISDNLYERQQIIETLSPLLYTKEEKYLIIDNIRRYKAIFDGSSMIDNTRFDGATTLKFVALDPIAYGNNVKLIINNGDKLMNGGNYKTNFIMDGVANSNIVKVNLVDREPYDYIKISNLNVGDKISIDMEEELVTVNGEDYMLFTDPLGDFFSVEPGEFSLSFSGLNSVTLTFDERWI